MPYQNLIFEKKEHIGTFTFNRPKLLNALNRQTMDELDALLTEARNDKDLRVLVLTGAGDKAFIAGADINELARRCGTGVGHELCLSGEIISAEEAQRIGLVNHVYESGELLTATQSLARKIAANAPMAVQLTMEAIERGLEMPQEQGLFLEA